ncbi:MAG: hypothetical protein RLZ98_155 [Pseudomonadota bacterium]|jgi:Rrf2 family protein
MELNTRGRYAVMAMADIAKHGGEGAVPLSGVAERQGLSAAYLEQLFLKLRRAGLVESQRGRAGGYVLGRDAREIRVSEIMAAVEEETRMTRCLGEGAAGCLGEERCLTHKLWEALGEEIQVFLSNVSLQDVLDGIPPRGVRPGAVGVAVA